MPLDNPPSDDLDQIYEEAGQRFGHDPDWLRSVAHVESAGNRYAISPAGAVGTMQVMPDTYADLRSRYPDLGPNPFKARDNIMAGAAYLREMEDKYGKTGSLAAYNAGPGRYDSYLAGTPLPDETNNYLDKVSSDYLNRVAQKKSPAAKGGGHWEPVQGNPFAGRWEPVRGDPFAPWPEGEPIPDGPKQNPLAGQKAPGGAGQMPNLPLAKTEAEAPLDHQGNPIPETAGVDPAMIAAPAMQGVTNTALDAARSIMPSREKVQADAAGRAHVLDEMVAGAKQGWQNSTFLTPQSKVWLEAHGYAGLVGLRLDQAISALTLAPFNALIGGAQRGAVAEAERQGVPGLGRDVAALPEAFPLLGRELGARAEPPEPNYRLSLSGEPEGATPPGSAQISGAAAAEHPGPPPTPTVAPTPETMATQARAEMDAGAAQQPGTQVAVQPPTGSGAAIASDIAKARQTAAAVRAARQPPATPAVIPMAGPIPVAQPVEGQEQSLGPLPQAPAATPPVAQTDKPPPRPVDAVTALIDAGGVRDDGGNLAAIGTDESRHRFVGQFLGRLINPNGMSPNRAREFLFDNGYLTASQADDEHSIHDVAANHAAGNPTYRAVDEADAWHWQQAQEAQAEQDRFHTSYGLVHQAALDGGLKADPATLEHAAMLHASEGISPEQAIHEAAYTTDLIHAGLIPSPELAAPRSRFVPGQEDMFGAKPPAPRERPQAEPTIRNDQRQAVMPGMEPSAVQAQAARDQAVRGGINPRGAVRPADEGLFAPAPVQQSTLPVAPLPRASRWLNNRGFQDQLPQYPTEPHPNGPHMQAADWVHSMGRESGHEHIAVVDNHTGQVVHAGTANLPNEIPFDENNTAGTTDRFTVHHNHPNSLGISGGDVGISALEGVSHVVAHTHNGDTFVVSITPRETAAIAHMTPVNRYTRQVLAHDESYNQAEKLVRPLYDNGTLTVDQANQTHGDVTARLMDAEGRIRYLSTRKLPEPVMRVLRTYLEGKGYGRDVVDRSTRSVLPEERVASLPAANAEPPGQGEHRGADGNQVSAPVPKQTSLLREEEGKFGRVPDRELPGIGHNQGPPGLPPQVPPGGMFGPSPPPPHVPTQGAEPFVAAVARRALVKNLGEIQKFAIFPRTLASLDDKSGIYYDRYLNRTTETATNTDKLRQVIPNFLKLSKSSRLRVGAALEMGRIQGEPMTEPDGRVIVHNTSVPRAAWSHVGERYALTPEETVGYHEAKQLGDAQWDMLMHSVAKRFGWNSPDLDTARMREIVASHATRGSKQLGYLADLLDLMKANRQDIYFPMHRPGSHYIAVRPIQGEPVVAGGGGHPPLAHFEMLERPAAQDVFGKTKGMFSVDKAARARVEQLRKEFPPDKFEIEHGDIIKNPDLLRRMDIPAIQKLFMLMENGVKRDLIDQVMQGEGAPATKAGIRAEANRRYEETYGGAVDTFIQALFNELKAGYRRKANVVPGYSKDFDRAIASHLYQIARNSADMVHRDGIESAFNALERHPHPSVTAYWKQWSDYQNDPTSPLTRWANNLNQVGFAAVMGMNPSSTLIMGLHTPLMAAPVLSVGVGPHVATGLLTQGLGRAYRSIGFDKSHGAYINLERAIRGLPEDKQAFIRQMASEGRLASLGAEDLGRLTEDHLQLFGSDTPHEAVRSGLRIATSNVAVTDMANRMGVALAAWDIAQNPARLAAAAEPWLANNAIFRSMVERDGLNATTYGRFMLSQAAMEWSKANRPVYARSWYGTLLSALHGFQTRYLSAQFNLLKNMGAPGRVAGFYMMGALFMVAGLAGIEFSQDMTNLIDRSVRGLFGFNPGTMFAAQDWMAKMIGSAGASIIMHGPTGYVTGIDLSSRTGFGDVISRSGDGLNILGTFPEILWNSFWGAKARHDSGQTAAAVAAEAVPFGARGPLRAVAQGDQGVLSRKGMPIRKPEEITTADKLRTALGFTPLAQRESQEEIARYIQAQEGLPAVKQKFLSGDIGGASQDLRAMGWSPKRIMMQRLDWTRERNLGHPLPSKQFQRFEQQRHAP